MLWPTGLMLSRRRMQDVETGYACECSATWNPLTRLMHLGAHCVHAKRRGVLSLVLDSWWSWGGSRGASGVPNWKQSDLYAPEG
jgi:hypothetical protein